MPRCISFCASLMEFAHSRVKFFTRLFPIYVLPYLFFFPFPSIDTTVINLLQEPFFYIIPNLYLHQ